MKSWITANRCFGVRLWRKGVTACLIILFSLPFVAMAGIHFEDVSQSSGIYHLFSTAASAWGDYNGDGWPDLWVSNHWHQPPSLYLNQQDGTFVNVAETVIEGKLPADFHGASWVDFDNDGDQDLFVTTGGGAGEGTCPNFLFVNDGQRLKDEAAEYKIDYPLGRGRTPLWFDTDGDGRLDVIVMNRFRPGAPSAIFLQTDNGFLSSNERFQFDPSGKRSNWEKGLDLLYNLSRFRFRVRAGAIMPTNVFAQLADLTGDHRVELISFVEPMRLYDTGEIPFKEISNQIGFPTISTVRDTAIGDFNGDGQMELFVARRSFWWGVNQVSSNRLNGRMSKSGPEKSQVIHFRSDGEVTFQFYTPWVDPSVPQTTKQNVFLGDSTTVPIDDGPIVLDPQDRSIHRKGDSVVEGISVYYEPDQKIWVIESPLPHFNFTVTSVEPIEQVERIGFTNVKGARTDALLRRTANGYQLVADALPDIETNGSSVTAGDFDNDMDLDLYMVCSGLAENLPNILMENDGKGNFIPVADTGGASGSTAGIGNQVVSADYDRDGFLDLFVTNGDGNPPFCYDGPHQLFHNMGNGNHWIEIDLEGTVSNREAIGAVVELEADGVTQIRNHGGGMRSFSQDHGRIHFGLGTNEHADRITIKWPSGTISEMTNVKADQIMRTVEPGSEGNTATASR